MSEFSQIYSWESEAELATDQPEEAAIYYEWLLGLASGSKPGEALLRVGVSDVRGVEGRLAGWIPVFFVDDVDEAIARLRPGTWRLLDTGDGDGAYVADEQGSVVRLRERAAGRSGGSMNFDYSALDLAAAERFYTRLLDLEAAEVVDDTYAMRFLTSGRGIVAGVFQLSGIERLDRRPAWITYFEVDSVEELVNRAVQSGSRVRIPPVDSPINRYAVLDDPWGNLYGFSSLFGKERIGTFPMRGAASAEPSDYAEILFRNAP
ncbi:VOC family protein [Leucobacter soli]|uniref:VOC domain-containing protein n=1 Tax=Leucobacter soli TaxID=2812850 RepID=A0A916JWU8_9MICO|nr:VOC family protein [Leucobacter soli]CAG7610362.1 hypothetical protein LEUCIP111803_01306 [Leucobacter soli]